MVLMIELAQRLQEFNLKGGETIVGYEPKMIFKYFITK